MITINGNLYTKEEAKEILADPAVVVEVLEVSLNKKSSGGERILTNEGFDIPREMIVGMSTDMDKFDAGFMCASFENCKTIMDKSIFIFMVNPGYVPKWKMFIWKILKAML